MAIGNLSRIGKHVPLTELQSKGGSIDMLDYHTLANQYRTKALVTGSQLGMVGFAQKFNIKSAMVAVKGFKVNSQTYMAGNSDYNGPYHVSELFFDIGSPGTHKLYVGHAATLGSGNQWCNDTSIAGAQILDLDGTVLHNIRFTDGTMEQNLTPYSNSSRPTPQTLSAQTYTSIATGSIQYNQFNYKIGTGSSRTGAQYGINSSQFDDVPFPLSLSDDQPTISQYYGMQMFREMTTLGGATAATNYNKTLFMRTQTSYSIPTLGSIRIAYNNSTETARLADLDANGTLFLGFY
jgi:hypothetical protein